MFGGAGSEVWRCSVELGMRFGDVRWSWIQGFVRLCDVRLV